MPLETFLPFPTPLVNGGFESGLTGWYAGWNIGAELTDSFSYSQFDVAPVPQYAWQQLSITAETEPAPNGRRLKMVATGWTSCYCHFLMTRVALTVPHLLRFEWGCELAARHLDGYVYAGCETMPWAYGFDTAGVSRSLDGCEVICSPRSLGRPYVTQTRSRAMHYTQRILDPGYWSIIFACGGSRRFDRLPDPWPVSVEDGWTATLWADNVTVTPI